MKIYTLIWAWFNFSVEALIAEDGRVFSADEDFENLPESKSVKEAKESNILEVKYKFSNKTFKIRFLDYALELDPSERKTSRNHELNKKKWQFYQREENVHIYFLHRLWLSLNFYFCNSKPFLLK